MRAGLVRNNADAKGAKTNDSLQKIIEVSAQVAEMLEDIDLDEKDLLLTKDHILSNLLQLIENAAYCNSEINSDYKTEELKVPIASMKPLVRKQKNERSINHKLISEVAMERVFVNNEGRLIQ